MYIIIYILKLYSPWNSPDRSIGVGSLSLLQGYMYINIYRLCISASGFQSSAVLKNVPANAIDTRHVVSIPGSGRFPGVGTGKLLQCFCLENSMVREAWQATIYGVAKS